MSDRENQAKVASLYMGSTCLGLKVDNFDEQDEERQNIWLSVPETGNCQGQKYTGEELLKQFKDEFMNLMYEICECETDEDRTETDALVEIHGRVRAGEHWTQECFDEVRNDYKQAIETAKSYRKL